MPFLLPEELPEADCPPIRVRLLGEDLIAFRDSRGQIGLLDRYCPHRRVDLFYGRNEECGLRCVYHGWKFDTTGAIVDMPAEPDNTQMKQDTRIKSYPVMEWGGVIWAYMGPRETPPPLPDLEANMLETGWAVASTVAGNSMPSAPVDTIEISSAAVELSQAELQAAISVKILKVAQNIGRQTLDLFA